MAYEIERKFLVTSDSYKSLAFRHTEIKQGYLNRDPDRTVRVRIKDNEGKLTVKGLTHGLKRLEFEYDIPLRDAEEMMTLCEGKVIDKTRWLVTADDGHIWEVDEFHGREDNLAIAEIELASEDEVFTLPPFLGPEVTGNTQYYNSAL